MSSSSGDINLSPGPQLQSDACYCTQNIKYNDNQKLPVESEMAGVEEIYPRGHGLYKFE